MQNSETIRWRALSPLALVFTFSALMSGCGAVDATTDNGEVADSSGDTPVNEAPDEDSETDNGGDSGVDNPVSSTALPEVNSNLTTDSPEGIWMLVAEESSEIPNAEDSMNPFLFKKTNREFVSVTENGDGIYVLTRCDGSWRDEYELTETETGYDATYSETTAPDEGGVEYTTTTQFSVVYGADNQTLTV